MSEAEFQSEGIRAASKAARNNTVREVPEKIELSNGIVLKVKAMPPMLLNSVANSIPEPEVPVVYMEDKDREEPNPNHPAYLQAVQDRQIKIGLATNNLILYACTELESIPEDATRPEDDKWLPLARMAGIDIDEADEVQRYLAWLRCYALATIDDLNKAMTVPLQLAGITEAEVAEVVDTFRSGEGGDSTGGLSVVEPSANGNHVQNSNPRSRGRPRRT